MVFNSITVSDNSQSLQFCKLHCTFSGYLLVINYIFGVEGYINATKICHLLNVYIFETNNYKVMNNASVYCL